MFGRERLGWRLCSRIDPGYGSAMEEAKPCLVVATRNGHKVDEIRQMVGARFVVASVIDFAGVPEVAETGTTFLENATLKAEAVSRHLGGLALADDSGLEIDALGGRPGVWSSSFGGEEGHHEKNNRRLEAEMAGRAERGARFRCVMVLARDGRAVADFEGVVEGVVASRPRGEGGFGYDPWFVPQGYEQTFAELGQEVKNQLSHRGRALKQVVRWLDAQPRPDDGG